MNKRGSSSVFLMVIIAALVTIVLTLIYSVREESVKSRIDGITNLAGDSIISEFNYYVQKDYGLFMIKGSEDELCYKMRNYIEPTISMMEDINIDSITVSGKNFSLTDQSIMKEQILDYMKTARVEGYLDEMKKENQENIMPERTLRHGPTVIALPSRGVESSNVTELAEYIADKSSDIGKAFDMVTDKNLINSYVFMKFNNRVNAVNEDHFFKNEVEYIIGGELSDRKNEKRIEIALKALRFPLNLAHIYADSEKNAATLAMAEILTPGAAAATQAVLASTWAYAEADNDVELLWEGHSVPFAKDKKSWAMDLDSAIEGLGSGTVIPEEEKGYTYDEYLRILTYFQNEKMQIARVMDLIQINMRKQYDSGFLINEHAAGINIDVTVNGRKYSYEKKY